MIVHRPISLIFAIDISVLQDVCLRLFSMAISLGCNISLSRRQKSAPAFLFVLLGLVHWASGDLLDTRVPRVPGAELSCCKQLKKDSIRADVAFNGFNIAGYKTSHGC